MKRLYITATTIAIILVLFAIISCKTIKNSTTTNKTTVSSNEVKCQSIIIDTAALYIESDSFLLIGAELKDDCLEIEVEYSGGCGGDVWTLAWTGILMKSLPPKANIYLHLKDDDACREIVRKKVSFDISSIHDKEVIFLLKNFRGFLKYIPN